MAHSELNVEKIEPQDPDTRDSPASLMSSYEGMHWAYALEYCGWTMSMASLQAQFVLPGRFSRMMSAMCSVTNTGSLDDVVRFRQRRWSMRCSGDRIFIVVRELASRVKPDERRLR